MKPYSFALLYALREWKQRKRTFLPLLCAAAGVMILMTNILIYVQCDYTSDLAYYKTNTHLILNNITSSEADQITTLSYVESVDTVPDGKYSIAYVKLRNEYLDNIRDYAECGVRIIRDLHLENRDPYRNYLFRAEKEGITHRTFVGSNLFNYAYSTKLAENPVYLPSAFFVTVVSALSYFAALWLVFSMKIQRGSEEFAAMRSFGASMGDLRSIQRIEAIGVTLAAFFPSLGISLAVMKLTCICTESLYPDFGMNSLLLFDVPWLMIGFSLLLYIVAAYLAVAFASRRLQKRTVTALFHDTEAHVPFVEKSSVRLLNSPDFRPYFRVELKRTLRHYLPPQILFCLLILFPLLLVGGLFSFGWPFAVSDAPTSVVYSLESMYTSDYNGSIPRSLVEEILALDHVTGAAHRKLTDVLPFTSKTNHVPEEYLGEGLYFSYTLKSLLFDAAEDVPAYGTCIAPAELFSPGDTFTITVANKTHTITVSETREGLLVYRHTQPYYPWSAEILLSDETIAGIMEFREPRYQMVVFYGEKGHEVSLTRQIEACAGYSHPAVNDHERQLRQRTETLYTGSAVYVEKEIRNFYDAFLFIFVLVEVLFLLLCTGSIIASVTAYSVSGRNREFAILRALGMSDGEIQLFSAKKQLLGIFLTLILAYIFLVASGIYMDSQQLLPIADSLVKNCTYTGTFQKLVHVLLPIRYFALQYLPTILLALVGYGACTGLASVRTVERILKKSIAECVKNKE